MAKTVLQDYKKWWKSRMVWLSILMIIFGAVETLTGFPTSDAVITWILGILNLILRFNTNEAIGK